MMRHLLLLALFSPVALAAQALDGSELDARIEALRVAYGAPGLAVAVVQDGLVIYARGFGHRDLERSLPVTSDTAFPIGSVSKQFTASLIGIYEGEGRLSVSDRPAEHIPELRFQTGAMDDVVTIEDLLTHRSGLGNVDGALVFFPDTNRQTLRIDRLAHLEPSSGVRERLDYSNGGYGLLGALAERISGRKWSEEMRDRIFVPMGMTRSSTDIEALAGTENVAIGYAMVAGQPDPGPYEGLYEASPGGAVVSTVSDLARWMTLLMDAGKFEDTQIVPAEYLNRAFSIHSLWGPSYDSEARSLDLNAYGYGWGISQLEGRLRIAHSGATSGFTARMEFLPSENIGVVVLTNQHVSGIPDWVAEIAYRHLLEDLPTRETESFPVNIVDTPAVIRDRESVVIGGIDSERPPTSPLGGYAGEYSHPGYGAFTVALRDGVLYADFPAFSFALEHEQVNTFVLRRYYAIHVNSPTFPVNFQIGFDGSVTGAIIPLRAEPVHFDRNTEALLAEIARRLASCEALISSESTPGHSAGPSVPGVADALQGALAAGVHTEATLNALGYEYHQANKFAMAVAVFGFNAKAFPDSWNAHDSLGEGLAAAGRTPEAIDAYARSLVLNPNNTGGRAALSRLQGDK